MITKIQGEAPFQVLTNNFSISPSQEGYTLQISADGVNYSNLFSVGANVTRLVTGVAANSYYRLLGNNSEVSINWMKTCVTEGGGSGSGTTYTAGEYISIDQDVISVTGITPDLYLTTADTQDFATQADITAATSPIQSQVDDIERVTATALTELHDAILDLSGATEDFATEAYVDDAIEAAMTGITPDVKIVKASGNFPADPDLGDMVSKNSPEVYGYWDYSDGCLIRFRCDYSKLNTGSTYTLATFQSPERANPTDIKLYYGAEDWFASFFENDVEITGYDIIVDSTVVEHSHFPYDTDEGSYVGLKWTTAGGWCMELGMTDGNDDSWSCYDGIQDLETYDITSPQTDVAEGPYFYDGNDWKKVGEVDLAPAFPRMPYFDLEGGGRNLDEVKSALFDVGTETEIYLLDTAFNWVNDNVDWGDADVPVQFTIDPDEKVAYVENIPAGNYIFGLWKNDVGENYDGFNIDYWSKEEGDWTSYAIDNSTDAIWYNPDFVIDGYWRDRFSGDVVLTNNGEYFNWSFPKDVERFEIRIVDDGQGNESLEINTTYKEDPVRSGEDFGQGIINKIVKLTQSDYDDLVNDDLVDPDTFYVIVSGQ